MKTVFVDTSAFYAAMDATESNHAPSLDWFRRADQEEWSLLTHNYVAHETWALLQARLGCSAVERWERVLLARCEIVWVDAMLHSLGASRCRQAKARRLSLTDCVSIELMRREGVRFALAYDDHFRSEGIDLPPGSQ